MIARDDRIELSPHGPHEHRVTGKRPADIDPTGATGLDRWLQDPCVLLPHESVFSGVWVQTAKRDLRMRGAEARQLRCRELDRALDPVASQ